MFIHIFEHGKFPFRKHREGSLEQSLIFDAGSSGTRPSAPLTPIEAKMFGGGVTSEMFWHVLARTDGATNHLNIS